MNYEFLIDAWQINEQGQGTQVNPAELDNYDGVWMHCNRSSAEFEQWLGNEGFSEAIVKSLLATDTRPRFQQIDEESFFLILRGVNLNSGKQPDDMLTIRLLYTPNRLISCNLQRSRAIQSVISDFKNGQGPKSIEMLIVAILTQVNLKIESVLEPIEEFIDAQDVESYDVNQVNEINAMHKKLLRLNRFLKPQTHALTALSKIEMPVFEQHLVGLANQLDNLQRIVDTIDFDIAQIDVINSRIVQIHNEVINRNTYLLSIIAGIFLPLGFLTGLFGINIGGMPGVENSDAFYWFCGILTGIGVFEVVLFRRLKFL
ncbi:zinc transporter ZntB [Thalassotalea marina]|uniref:Zinc transporter ZntB n=1 Tax=Thalassotalea marina TaxID=1673741 RepID=A0A919BIM4_9GAMM|nr:zinc transporter ZntB [Thalassotalea marina]GHF91504.1 zinc transporter ZntB [Thalassotalea marina]